MLGLFLGFGNSNKIVKMGMVYTHVCVGEGSMEKKNIYKLNSYNLGTVMIQAKFLSVY